MSGESGPGDAKSQGGALCERTGQGSRTPASLLGPGILLVTEAPQGAGQGSREGQRLSAPRQEVAGPALLAHYS